MREREAAKKTKLSSFRFFFDQNFCKNNEEEESETTSFRFSRRRGQKRKEKENLFLSLSSS
jgi:hypothetical protein